MWSKHPQPDSDQHSSDSLERRLRMTSQRYQLFFTKAGEILNQAFASGKAEGETFRVAHHAHISDFLSADEVEPVVRSGELRDSQGWVKHMREISDTDSSELVFDDWPDANAVLDGLPNRHDAAAQVLALHESFAGFVNLLVSWVELQDQYVRLITLCKEHGRDETGILLELAAILPDEVPGLPAEDIQSASVFILEMVESQAGSSPGA